MSDPDDLRWLMFLWLNGQHPNISVPPLSPDEASERIVKYRLDKDEQAALELEQIEQEIALRKKQD